jgi:GntR family transcriptional regulator, transcriptional repressor for pyruvate dehydrogenase complex
MIDIGGSPESAKYTDSSLTSGYRPGYDSIAEQIVSLVNSGSYKEGDRLPTEAELARQLGVGRSVVREAVKMLSAVGFLRVRRGSGVYVGNGGVFGLGGMARVEPDQVHQLFEFRLVVEPHAASMAAKRITVAQARRLHAAIDINRSGAERGDRKRFVEGDRQLHLGIAEATGNRFIVATVRQTMVLQSWVVHLILGGPPGSLMQAVEEHEGILRALKAGDAAAARLAMSEHIRTSRGNYQAEARRRLLPDELAGS